MIEKYLKPKSVSQAVALKKEHGEQAIYFGGGSKLNATPTKTDKTIAIDLNAIALNQISQKAKALHIGAVVKLQILLDNPLTPAILKQAIKFIYSRNIRNQATLAGEIAAQKEESPIMPSLMVLQAELLLANDKTTSLENYLASDRSELIQSIIIPDTSVIGATKTVRRSAAGLNVVTVAVATPTRDKTLIAIDGIANHTVRIHSLENSHLEGKPLEEAIYNLLQPKQKECRLIGSYKHTQQYSLTINPKSDIRGSIEYKSYISGVLVADLLSICREQEIK